ncbi:MAG TPA: aldehyde ferredoxin oxidoreductase family protein [Candidatus Methanoperedenaceae archaeon]|nr:aldehyde ferredoxin oxidoreductase family protein [Candidatus Methanoperedenaceae archaeon]
MAYRLLRVDLSSRKIRSEELHENLVRKFLGGKGLAAYFLYREQPPGADPLGGESKVAVMAGPLTGCGVSNCTNTAVCAKSPATGTWNDSHFNGYFGPELRYSGYLGMIIEGAADEPVRLHIENGDAELLDARSIMGLDTFSTHDAIKRMHPGKREARVLCIGQAGERRAKLAAVISELRAAARGGLGAVLGAKRLKAVSVTGHGKVVPQDTERFKKARKAFLDKIRSSDDVQCGVKLYGTAELVNSVNNAGGLPTNNFRTGYSGHADDISGESFRDTLWKRQRPCPGCAVACSQTAVITEGKYSGITDEGPEYETITLLGSNCGIYSREAIAAADYLCDFYGMDTISTGNTIAFLMECVERKLVDFDLRFGDENAFINAIHLAGRGEGFGELISNGVRDAASRIGCDSERFAMHVKGLEIPAYLPRAAFGQALAYAVSDRGACHLRPWIFGEEAIDSSRGRETTGKALMVRQKQERSAIYDSVGICKFFTYAGNLGDLLELWNGITGFDMQREELVLSGRRINVLTRAFNNREGFTRKDDTLPWREMHEQVPTGPAEGSVIEPAVLEGMLDEFYAVSGYTKDGVVPESLMRELGIL